MSNQEYDERTTSINMEKRIFTYLFLTLILVVNIIVLNSEEFCRVDNNNLSYSYLSMADTEDNAKKTINSYICKNEDCKKYSTNKSTNEVFIKDGGYYKYNFQNKKITQLPTNNIEYTSIKYINKNYMAFEYNNKYAVYDVKANKIISDFIYDGVITNNLNNIDGAKYGAYIKDGKYNQKLDVFDKDNNIIKHYDYCTKLDSSNKLLCSEHVQGLITQEEIDKELDKVLKQYPKLNDDRLFTVKTAIETVGLPYFWGGGHGSLKDTLSIATTEWNNTMRVVTATGSKFQESGMEYPSGFDCSGFVRWVIYQSTGIDVMSKGVSVIGGRNNHPDYTAINEEELLPGDLIMDKDHVTIYLYKNEKGKNISVHASFDHLKVEISNYKKGKEYFRLNIWK